MQIQAGTGVAEITGQFSNKSSNYRTNEQVHLLINTPRVRINIEPQTEVSYVKLQIIVACRIMGQTYY